MSNLRPLGSTLDDPQCFLTKYQSNFSDGKGLVPRDDHLSTVYQGSLPMLVNQTLQESGFTQGSSNPLVWPMLPDSQPSSQRTILLPQKMLTGRKECSGFVRNKSNLQTLGSIPDDPQRFLTNYQRK
ncbi:uncharacterized protein ppp1r32 [Megalops cyprinoides]|uniref:uncharacterized protein ppp1r32 n=1 Tax=Megalops cyprinoides TaxID=118141 RepID=UPI00186449E6|nr:uncharacterized protein ppp1r32 [Megalops cyprinoides]